MRVTVVILKNGRYRKLLVFMGHFFVIFFFSLMVYLKKGELKSVLWKVSVYSSHTSQIVHFIFVWKKRSFQQSWHKLYQQPFCSLIKNKKNNPFCIIKFYKCIYCLKSLLGLMQTQFLCMLFLDTCTVPSSRMYKNTFFPVFGW